MKIFQRSPWRAQALVGTLTAAAVLTGCSAQSPPGHEERLSKAAGLARITLVCAKDLWEETKPKSGLNSVKATVSTISSGPRANRGLVRVTMTGTNLVAYLKELDDNGHPSVANGEQENTAASRRVYDALAPKIDKIKAARSESDPEPSIIIDDTIPDKH
ncbi:hypothetical protein AB0O20_35925 [Streptomyces kronopolitis]|uniref:hypothetical protein n=1 Tax=Streptomyces kronopolitis TaxID=1612435 RepID=UPI00341DC3FB